MQKTLKIFALPLAALSLLSCAAQSEESGTSSSEFEPADVSSDSSVNAPIAVDKYVSAVSDTAAYLIAGADEGEAVDYVVSSYPVIYSAMHSDSRKTELSVYANIAREFGEKYDAKGFPQAGLFIKSTLLEDDASASKIASFLAAFDASVSDLVAGGSKAVEALNAYGDADAQKSFFGFNANVIKGCQENNALAFIENADNPSFAELSSLSDALGLSFAESDFADGYYGSALDAEVTASSTLEFSVITPQGAPAAAFAQYAGDENLTCAQPTTVSAAFSAGEQDIIVFDSVNGAKLAKKNDGNYKLARMVTYGNLYVVATGNDADGVMDDGDYIISYGEGLVPDLAFKAVYGNR